MIFSDNALDVFKWLNNMIYFAQFTYVPNALNFNKLAYAKTSKINLAAKVRLFYKNKNKKRTFAPNF